MGNKLFCKGFPEKPGNYREVFALIIGRGNEGVLVPAKLCSRGAIVSSVFLEKRRKSSTD